MANGLAHGPNNRQNDSEKEKEAGTSAKPIVEALTTSDSTGSDLTTIVEEHQQNQLWRDPSFGI